MHHLRLVLLALFAALIATIQAPAQTTGAADEYFRGYILKGEAERAEAGGDLQTARGKYQQAKEIFESIAKNYPVWESQMLSYRRQKVDEAIKRVEARLAAPQPIQPAPAPTGAAAPSMTVPLPQPGAPGVMPAAEPAAGAAAAPATLPSLTDLFKKWEDDYRQRLDKAERENQQYVDDLKKWQTWYGWASGELKASKETTNALAQRSADLEQAVVKMQKDVNAGKAVQGQLDALKKQQAETSAQLAQAQQKYAEADRAAKAASQKVTEISTQLASLKVERDKLATERDSAVKERDEAVKKADVANKERDKLAAESLGAKSELDALKRTMGSSGSNKDLLARNEALIKELDAARAQITVLKSDVTKKEAEIAQLKGQLTTVQGELATLRQQNSAFQTQVAELTLQLKDVQSKMDGKPAESPEVLAENQVLRSIILRQLRAQARQQQAQSIIIAELQKTENASKELIAQVEELSAARVSLTPDEEKLFTDPQLKEALSAGGFQATLMASRGGEPSGKAPASSAPAPSPAIAGSPAPGSATALLEKANSALQDDKLTEAVTAYEEVLRAEPKNATALIGLGAAKMRQGKFADAEMALKKCLTHEPENDTAHFTLGITYFKEDRNKEAMSSFEKSLVKRPQNARAHHYLGIIATRMSLLDRAEREFKTALAIDPAYGDAHFNLAVLYVSWDPPKWDQARTHYADALKKGVKPDPNLEKILNGAAAVSAR